MSGCLVLRGVFIRIGAKMPPSGSLGYPHSRTRCAPGVAASGRREEQASGDRLDRPNHITLPEVTGCAGHVHFPRLYLWTKRMRCAVAGSDPAARATSVRAPSTCTKPPSHLGLRLRLQPSPRHKSSGEATSTTGVRSAWIAASARVMPHSKACRDHTSSAPENRPQILPPLPHPNYLRAIPRSIRL